MLSYLADGPHYRKMITFPRGALEIPSPNYSGILSGRRASLPSPSLSLLDGTMDKPLLFAAGSGMPAQPAALDERECRPRFSR